MGKAFDASAPCSAIAPVSEIGHPQHGAVWLDVNAQRRQQGDLNQLIWKLPETIAYLSGLFRLSAGDLIFSGTPSGVGAIQRGDAMHGHVDGAADQHILRHGLVALATTAPSRRCRCPLQTTN